MAGITIATNISPSSLTGDLPAAAVSKNVTLDADTDTNSQTQTFAVSGGSDEQIAIGEITAGNGYWVMITNLEDADTGPVLNVSTATGGSFAGAVCCKVRPGTQVLMYFDAALYGKSADASLTCRCNIRAVEYTAA